MSNRKKNDNIQNLQSLKEVNKIIHEPARLLIIVNLYLVKSAESLFIKNQIGLTWGNLGSHINKLEEVEYITVKKEFKNKRPCSILSLTQKGRKAFEEYRNNMKDVIG